MRGDIVGRGCLLRVAGARERQYFKIVLRRGAAEPLFDQPHRQRRVGADDRCHHGGRVGGERRCAFLDMMAEPFQQARDLAHGGGDFRIDGVAIG